MGPNYAGILGLLAFVLTLTRGLIDGGSPAGATYSASIFLVVFASVGYFSGRVADQVLWDSVTRQFQVEMQDRGSPAQGAETPRA